MQDNSITTEEALQIAKTYHQDGKIADAEEIYRTIIEIDPEHADATFYLGKLALEIGCLNEGLALLKRAIILNPTTESYQQTYTEWIKQINDSALMSHEIILEQKDSLQLQQTNNIESAQPTEEEIKTMQQIFISQNYQEAKTFAEKLVEKYPRSGMAFNLLGVANRSCGDSQKSLELLQKAVQLLPSDYAIHYNLGVAYQDVYNSQKAIECFEKAIQLNPNSVDAYNNLGIVYLELEAYEQSINVLEKLLTIKPNYYRGHSNLGLAYKHEGNLHKAMEHFYEAAKLAPTSPEVFNNLGNALIDRGEFDAAIEYYKKASQLNPAFDNAYGNILFALNYHPDMSALEIFEYYKFYDKQRGQSHPKCLYYSNPKIKKRKLKIGYVSPDFKMHPVRLFLEPLLANHDKSQFEIYAYAQIFKEDIITHRYQQYADYWRITTGLSDDDLAVLIQKDGIDILIDVAGHTAGNRLQVFARKPAPISVSWLGFGYTTGLSAIDYYLTDEISAPRGSESLFSEQPWRVAIPSYVYRPAEGMGEVNELPAIQKGYVTFGTLSRSIRLNHRTIKAWADVLKKVENSKLVIDSKNYTDSEMVEKLCEKFRQYGIGKERLEIGYHSPPWDVLRKIDIGLDCFPHNSGTTLFEMLYMGIPYVTLADRISVGRLGSSILTGLNREEWIADTEEEYINKLVALASDTVTLAKIRASLRDQMTHSPLMDEQGFARKVENAYREMFEKWCDT